MNDKRVLLIGGNFYPELTGIGKYNGEMIEYLTTKGYQCSVVTTYPYYPFWKVQEPYAKGAYWFKKEKKEVQDTERSITIYRCPQYVPKKPSGLKRMLSDFSFSVSSFLKVFQLLFSPRFDYVITVAPGFQVGLLGIFYKKMKGAKMVYHVQDLQIDAARELNMINSKRLINALLSVERYIMRKADIVSSISPGMMRRIADKCKKPVHYFPNWVDTSFLYHLPNKNDLKSAFGFKASDFIVLYSGAIGEKQGLDGLLLAAKSLQHVRDLKFVVCGSGPYKQELIQFSEELGLNNVFFLPLQPYEKLNDFLNMADVHLVLQKANASDLVMPSKLASILSVGGVAIITASTGSSLHEMVTKHKMGILIAPENVTQLAKAIEEASTSNKEAISFNAINYAQEHLSIDQIFAKFITQLA